MLRESPEGYLLVPLSVKPAEKKMWLPNQAMDFFKEKIAPKLISLAQNFDETQALFLYGSRARLDALSNSDFDIGILCKKYPSFTRRNEIIDQLLNALELELKTLEQHGNHSNLSIHFFSCTIASDALPSIYYSIQMDCQLLWQRNKEWDQFSGKIRAVMREKEVKAVGEGKYRKWYWRQDG